MLRNLNCLSMHVSEFAKFDEHTIVDSSNASTLGPLEESTKEKMTYRRHSHVRSCSVAINHSNDPCECVSFLHEVISHFPLS